MLRSHPHSIMEASLHNLLPRLTLVQIPDPLITFSKWSPKNCQTISVINFLLMTNFQDITSKQFIKSEWWYNYSSSLRGGCITWVDDIFLSSSCTGEIAFIRSKSGSSIIIGCSLELFIFSSLICVWTSSYQGLYLCSSAFLFTLRQFRKSRWSFIF